MTGLVVDQTGKPLSGTMPEVLAGTGGGSIVDLDFFVPAPPVADARAQLLAGAGFCSLYVDLFASGDPVTRSGTLYMGNSLTDNSSAPKWSELLRLVRS